MRTYLVRMDHPDGEGWGQFVVEHVLYLKRLIAQGRLLASGPLKGTALRGGFLIMRAHDRADVQTLIDADPFAREALIETLEVLEWDPLFGMLDEHSSKQLPPEMAMLSRSE